MSLRDIAERLDIHESTVSRTVKNKFLQCPWGMYPMNYFFVKKVAADSVGEAMTPELVKSRIGEIIEKEDKKKPLSDQKISDQLKGMGIDVSRRTVAKSARCRASSPRGSCGGRANEVREQVGYVFIVSFKEGKQACLHYFN